MRILYLDPFSGVSGDMFVGTLIDLGVDLAKLHFELSKLGLAGYQLGAKRTMRGALSATKFDVIINGEKQTHFDAEPGDHSHAAQDHSHGHEHSHDYSHGHDHGHSHGDEGGGAHRTFAHIREMIEASALSERVRRDSVKVFHRLAEAEGKIHAMPPEQVTFHEVGAIDSIIDIVGVCVCLEMLCVNEVWCGPVALGGGFVKCDHGLIPVPAPATLDLMRGVPLRSSPVEKELTTPTGAALVAALVTRFCGTEGFIPERTGHGAGARERQAVPNVLRATLGESFDARGANAGAHGGIDSANDAISGACLDAHGANTGAGCVMPLGERGTIIEMQANIDDATPEALGYVMERLLAAGAVDVFYTPVQMKKNRPGAQLGVLCDEARAGALAEIVLRETTTFGVRFSRRERIVLSREMREVSTVYGTIRAKLGRLGGECVQLHPEYEDCKGAAEVYKVPLRVVQDAAREAARLVLLVKV